MKKINKLKSFFIFIFVISILYVTLIKDELYVSSSSIIIKDLSQNPANTLGLGIINLGNTSQGQDSKIVETYLYSFDVLEKVDGMFHLRKYYHEKNDPMHKLYGFSSQEYFLSLYQKDLEITYDNISGIITVSFAHTDPALAQKITAFLIEKAENQLNLYNRRNAQKQLDFVHALVLQNQQSMNMSIKKLEMYQNKQKLLDPSTEITSTSAILANLEASRVQKESERNQLSKYMNESSFDVVRLNNEIEEIKVQISNLKETMTGENAKKLNAKMIEFEQLKAQVEFDKNIYKESLSQLAMAQIDVSKQAKTLIVLTTPNLPDMYTYPNKLIIILNLILVLGMLYGIAIQLRAIIKDHKD